ncbi:hypothetical protein IW492_07135 [Enterococcus sp. BWB1-3]|uniref:hypothetical protein n=1 Tax=unclassified Enterococcus TaxID=2608891 RepID=UPI001923A35E|nr:MULTISPECIES: hypothetical protein [unclassified Enterococcus]MBL1229006.1 hypothetical protein [Enterococcus sp. BWB1-3]MCB5952275.1 hypothetical protein [Enterococcus sp. BWT-B8]MCB5955496.1 hypothetical protein [Enterococcus sp. CWB-B31]
MYRKKVDNDSEIKQSFDLEQKVSFIYKQEIRTGKIVKKLDYAAVVKIDLLASASHSEDKTVVNYSDLYKR